MRKRILFVDDEPRVLEGLRRLLRPQREQWEMFFADGGEQALALLDSSPIDVVVTDMRMPGMDGAQLLTQVYERHPGTVRIVLSGQFDQEAGMRAAPVAHQFLVKPCDPTKLIAAVERSGQASADLPDQATRHVVNAIGSLPSPPETCARLLAAIHRSDVSLDAVTAIIERDVALSAKILQMVNSAFFSLPCEVPTIKHAVGVLGLDLLKQLVISLEIQKRFQQVAALPGFSLQEFDRHSRLTAQIAAMLPAAASAAPLRTITALLHDTGKLVLASQLPDQFAKACSLARNERIPLHQAELKTFGTSHAEVGACLLNIWGFPRSAVDAIMAHHRPVLPPHPQPDALDLPALVHTANALALAMHQPPDELPATLDADYARSYGFLDKIASWRAAAEDL